MSMWRYLCRDRPGEDCSGLPTRLAHTGKRHVVTFQQPQCVVNPATSKQHCMMLPEGLDINSEDPSVQQIKKAVFAMGE